MRLNLWENRGIKEYMGYETVSGSWLPENTKSYSLSSHSIEKFVPGFNFEKKYINSWQIYKSISAGIFEIKRHRSCTTTIRSSL